MLQVLCWLSVLLRSGQASFTRAIGILKQISFSDAKLLSRLSIWRQNCGHNFLKHYANSNQVYMTAWNYLGGFPAPQGDGQQVGSWSQFTLLLGHLCYRFTRFWETEMRPEGTPEIITNSRWLTEALRLLPRVSLAWPTCVNLFASLWETSDSSKLDSCSCKPCQVNVAWKMPFSFTLQLWDSRPKRSKMYFLVQGLWQIFQNYS